MPTFTCKLCGTQICYPKIDRDHRERLEWECDECYLRLSHHPRRYEVNAKGKRTVFIPMGDALGDRIVQEVVKRRYLAENPDEEIIHLAFPGPQQYINVKRDILERYQPYKLFWGSQATRIEGQRPSSALWFSLVNEANGFAQEGHYPEFHDLEPVKNDWGRYVVLHIRHLWHSPMKNVSPFMMMKILMTLDHLRLNGVIDSVVLVGNDDKETNDPYPVWLKDRRKSMNLQQLAWVCKNAMLFVGKDSGVAHLAGTQRVPMVLWGFTDRRWMPKVPPGQAKCFMYSREVRMEQITDAIKSRLIAYEHSPNHP